jgi:hypothetical protein
MKRLPRLALLALLSILALLPSYSATLHALIHANTEDEDIGRIYDVVNMGAFLKAVQKETGLVLKAKVRLTVLTTPADKLATIRDWAEVVDGWSRKEPEKDIKAICPDKDDIFLILLQRPRRQDLRQEGPLARPGLARHPVTDLQYPVD